MLYNRNVTLVGMFIDAKDMITESTGKEPNVLALSPDMYRSLVRDLEQSDAGCVPAAGLKDFYGMNVIIHYGVDTGFLITTSIDHA